MASRSLLLAVLAVLVTGANGHGRLLRPAARSSMWRAGFNVPPNYDDNQLNCGGKKEGLANSPNKRCGICGDDVDNAHPRPNEAGGKYAKSEILAAKYDVGQVINVTVQLTASHKGFFEFRLCKNNNWNQTITQECLDDHLLVFVNTTDEGLLTNGSTRYHLPEHATKTYYLKLELPETVECTQCVLQWKYHAGNNYGCDYETNCKVGNGPQEEFYGCSDVSISQNDQPHTTTTPSIPSTASQSHTTTIPSIPSTASQSHTTTIPSTPSTASTHRVTSSRDIPTETTASVQSTSSTPTVSTTEELKCVVTVEYEEVPGMHNWCQINCFHNPPYCPETHCSCS